MDITKKPDGIENKNPGQNENQDKKNILTAEISTAAVTIQKNIETILDLEKKAVRSRSTAERIADKVTTFAGSTPFIILHAVWFGGWILLNAGIIPGIAPFDPFPFSFLTLVVSLEAIFLTLLVLMSQNRMTKEADKRAHLDLQINMLDEQETTMILRVVQKIAKHLGLEEETDESIKELCEATDVNRVAKIFDEKSSV
jgi:uncharacterized membrane protein